MEGFALEVPIYFPSGNTQEGFLTPRSRWRVLHGGAFHPLILREAKKED